MNRAQLSRRQRSLLIEAVETGRIVAGGWSRGQHHRPAWRLQEMGLLRFGLVPLSAYKEGWGRFWMQGWVPSRAGRRYASILRGGV